jgi:hypothetical protein
MKTNSSALWAHASKPVQTGLFLALAVMCSQQAALALQTPVNLGTAGNFVILTKSGISTVPGSAITGDIGVSPIESTAITGFALTLAANSPFATSAQITGKVYAPDYANPTPANLTTAISDMQTAYTDAAGRTTPDFTELGSGQIGGLTLVPGLYKWSTDVLISTDVTLNGGPNDVWIFQISGKITEANGVNIHLAGGALAANVFWQSFGFVSIGTTAHFDGRLLAQTAVTLDANAVTAPAAAAAMTLVSAATPAGPFSDAIGQSVNLNTQTFTVPLSGSAQYYRIRSTTAVTIASIRIVGGNAVITWK